MAEYQIHGPNIIRGECVYTFAGWTYLSWKQPFTKVDASVKNTMKHVQNPRKHTAKSSTSRSLLGSLITQNIYELRLSATRKKSIALCQIL